MGENVNELIDNMLDRENELSPPAATFKGVHDYDELWDDSGPEGIAAYQAYVDEYFGLVEAAAATAAATRTSATAIAVRWNSLRDMISPTTKRIHRHTPATIIRRRSCCGGKQW